MNNALLTDLPDENVVDLTVTYRQREQELVNIVDSIQKVAQTSEWKALQGLVFDGQIEALERELKNKSKDRELNLPDLYRLQGKIEIATRLDLDKLLSTYRIELANIRKRLK